MTLIPFGRRPCLPLPGYLGWAKSLHQVYRDSQAVATNVELNHIHVNSHISLARFSAQGGQVSSDLLSALELEKWCLNIRFVTLNLIAFPDSLYVLKSQAPVQDAGASPE